MLIPTLSSGMLRGMSWLTSIFAPLTSVFTEYRKGKVEVKQARIRRDVAKLDAEAAALTQQATAEGNWDMEALKQSQFSWKDEVLTVIFFLPFLGAFVPELQMYIKDGFVFLGNTPVWYQACIIGIVANAFGLRWWFTRKKL
jgi:hypothetical protein